MRTCLAVLTALLLLSAPERSDDARFDLQRAAAPPAAQPQVVPLPNVDGSLKIGVLGDFGDASTRQYQVAAQMAKSHVDFRYELVLLTGDNLYGIGAAAGLRAQVRPSLQAVARRRREVLRLARQSRLPRAALLQAVQHGRQAVLLVQGPKQNVRFIALESTYPEPVQIAWLEQELKNAREDWKVVFFHHPLYSSGERHGSDTELRDALEPLFVAHGVSIVFTGHDHFYERVKPQKGILYFVVGSGGRLRGGNIDRATGLSAAALDTDNSFLVGEFVGDQFTFQAISRTGKVVDSGSFMRRKQ